MSTPAAAMFAIATLLATLLLPAAAQSTCSPQCTSYDGGCWAAKQTTKAAPFGCYDCPGKENGNPAPSTCQAEGDVQTIGNQIMTDGQTDNSLGGSSNRPCNLLCQYSCERSRPVTTANETEVSVCCPGFEGAGCGKDTDACALSPCAADAICTDKPAPALADKAGRTCECRPGYTGDGETCAIDEAEVNWLSQADFAHGTYIIDKPGVYCLTENISFNPNPRVFGGNGMPWPDQLSDAVPGPGNDGYPTGKYDSRAYQLGFFAAIQVTAAGDDAGVDIDLQGFKLEQSAEHALAQRFFALIELASAPFHYDHGPHNFTTDVQLKSAEKVRIRNGLLGRSSHHGVHGIGCKDIEITDITIYDWEVAGISINGGKNIRVNQAVIGPSRTDVPVVGLFSTGIFIRPYLLEILASQSAGCGADAKITLNTVERTGADILYELDTVLNSTFDAVLHGIGEVPEIVSNYGTSVPNGIRAGLPDGSAIYGMVFANYGTHTAGFAVERNASTCLDPLGEVIGMIDEKDTAQGWYRCTSFIDSGNDHITISNTRVQGVKLQVNEVAALRTTNFENRGKSFQYAPQVDVRGAVYQLEVNVDGSTWGAGNFKGNPISNAQLFATKHLQCLANRQKPAPKCPVSGATTPAAAATTAPPAPGCTQNQLEAAGVPKGGDPRELGLELNLIRESTLDWAAGGGQYKGESGGSGDDLFICGGDNMFHVNKGAHGIRVDAGAKVVLQNVVVDTVDNTARPGSSRCGNEAKRHPQADDHVYAGGDATGVTVAAAQDVTFEDVVVRNVKSSAGSAYGVHIMNKAVDIKGTVSVGAVATAYKSLAGSSEIQAFYDAIPPVRPDYQKGCVKKEGVKCHTLPIANPMEVHRFACRINLPGMMAMMGVTDADEATGMAAMNGGSDDLNAGVVPLDPRNGDTISCSLVAHMMAINNDVGGIIPVEDPQPTKTPKVDAATWIAQLKQNPDNAAAYTTALQQQARAQLGLAAASLAAITKSLGEPTVGSPSFTADQAKAKEQVVKAKKLADDLTTGTPAERDAATASIVNALPPASPPRAPGSPAPPATAQAEPKKAHVKLGTFIAVLILSLVALLFAVFIMISKQRVAGQIERPSYNDQQELAGASAYDESSTA